MICERILESLRLIENPVQSAFLYVGCTEVAIAHGP